jgi:two-component system chemotaxis sensor kinase CheA
VKASQGSLSIGFKLACGITALALTITVSLTALLSTERLRAAEAQLEQKTIAYGRLASRELQAAVAFDDTETAREVFDALRLDREVVGVALYDRDGQLLASAGDSRAAPEGASASSAMLRRDRERMTVVAPVIPKEGGRGTVVVELSVAALTTARAEMLETGAAVAAGGLVLGLLGAWIIGRSLRRRLSRLSEAAAAISRGNLFDKPIEDTTRDEVGRLGEAFDGMRVRLADMVTQAARQAAEEQERLDELVRARTAELDERNHGMRFLLDHLGEGVVSVDAQGRLGEEHSRAVVDWFGPPTPGDHLWRYLGDLDIASALEIGWGAITDGFLPLELALDQLPKRVVHGGRIYEMVVSPVQKGDGAVDRFIVFFSDVTAAAVEARAVAGQRDLATALAGLAKDRSGFLAQMEEADHLVQQITSAEQLTPELKRALHTLKGNAAILGFESLAERCHHMETFVSETDEVPPVADRLAAREAWLAVWQPVEALRADRDATVVVERADLSSLRRAIEAGQSKAKLLERVRAFTFEPAGKRLERLAEWVKRAASRYGKPEPRVEIDDGGLRFDEETWEPFWSACVHLVRNAVAHGIELPSERESRAKPSAGRLTLRCAVVRDRLVVTFADDGRGVDWARVRDSARERGLPASTHDDLVEALFHQGLSTRREADELSGRGEGLGAVREAVRALGGVVAIETERGARTEVSATFALGALGATIAVGSGVEHEGRGANLGAPGLAGLQEKCA